MKIILTVLLIAVLIIWYFAVLIIWYFTTLRSQKISEDRSALSEDTMPDGQSKRYYNTFMISRVAPPLLCAIGILGIWAT